MDAQINTPAAPHAYAADAAFAAGEQRPAAAPAPFIEVRGLVAAYEGKIAVHGVSLSVPAGAHLSLLGPSGCGKSTMLRSIAGLETPLEGEIIVDGRTVFSSARRINVPAEKRRLSMVFQSYAIWPHMSVKENVGYGLRLQGVRGQELHSRVLSALDMVGMAAYIDRPATDLSGGQQQRVALARAYAFSPKAVLLDEPLSNLDARLRARMRTELKDLQNRLGLTTIYVTHDQEEAMAMSDQIIIMREGRIEQAGRPLDIYDTPRSRFVADFVGAANILEAEVTGRDGSGHILAQVGGAHMRCAPRENLPKVTTGGRQLIAVRTVYPQISTPAATPGESHLPENTWPARIERREILGDVIVYTVGWPGGSIRAHAFPSHLLEEGRPVTLHIPPERAILVAADE
ncbi:ABC transporter ATP-binding protein [Xanthobacter dioxanivorans]|uniref:ABC transporter ATP-binding protein n=1 Tax=Xanthobacter dioxanivorans TaxID=2528964 RepID=A0A974SM08_9HYPH|nr:ABC transporter ATP-binding protein [Xanthobacter dioxanivorans]QRG09128.1 ABC transporter ATP-binding protein [Xanthobacter dioxanivorans]